MNSLNICTALVIFATCLTANCCAQTKDIYSENVDAAQQCFQNKEYIKAARLYSKAFFSNHNLGRVDHRYSAARCWALGGEIDSAFYQLDRIVKVNYSEYLEISTDTAFTGLRYDMRWTKLMNLVRTNEQKREEYSNSSFKNLNKPLVVMLDSVYLDDQLYRKQMDEIAQKYGWTSPEMDTQIKLINTHDEANKEKVTRIFDQYGWLSKEEVGEQGNETLFLVIQHADLATQLHYLPLLRDAVKHGKAQPASLALLEDRLALKHGKKQIYGSQIIRNSRTGKYYLQPLQDPQNVDKRRAEVGLSPIKEYVSQWGINWSIEQYEKDLTDNKEP